MDVWTFIALMALVVAAVALALVFRAWGEARQANGTAAGARDAAEELRRQVASVVERLQALETRQAAGDAAARAAAERVAALEVRLAQVEARLRELDELASPVPPPIPSGRSLARLEELRATLRAQAAEASDESDETGDEPHEEQLPAPSEALPPSRRQHRTERRSEDG